MDEEESAEVIKLLNAFKYQKKSKIIAKDGWCYAIIVKSKTDDTDVSMVIESEHEIAFKGGVYYSTAKHGLYEFVENRIN